MPGRREVPGERAAAGAAADDDDVESTVAGHDPPTVPRARLVRRSRPPARRLRPRPRSSGASRSGPSACGARSLPKKSYRPALERVDAVAAAGHERGVDAEPGRERHLAVQLDALDLGDRRTRGRSSPWSPCRGRRTASAASALAVGQDGLGGRTLPLCSATEPSCGWVLPSLLRDVRDVADDQDAREPGDREVGLRRRSGRRGPAAARWRRRSARPSGHRPR